MPLTVPDQTIASQVQVPNGMNTMASMMDMQGKAQNLQIGRQTLQSNDMKLQGQDQANQERIGLQGFMQNPDNWQTNGKIDMGKLNAAVPKIAPMTGGDVLGKLSELSNSQTTAAQASQNLTQSQRGIVASTLGVLGRAGVGDVGVYNSELDNLGKQFEGNKDMASLIGAYKTQLSAAGSGDHLAKGAITASQSLLSNDTQQSALSPKPSYLNTGGAFQPTMETSSAGGNPPSLGLVPGAPTVRGTVPPTQLQVNPDSSTSTVGGVAPAYNPASSQSQGQWVGPEPKGNYSGDPEALRQRILQNVDPSERAGALRALNNQIAGAFPGQKPGGVTTSLPVGASGNLENNTAEMNRHFASLQDQSGGAALVQSLTGNIKSLAAGAATGGLAGKKAWAAGMLNALGVGGQATGDLQHDTDLIEKNMAQLNMATPGTTDAARALVHAGRPNSGMAETSITDAADQVASQIKSNMAVRNFLTPYKFGNNGQGDAAGYQNARQTIEGVADPRAWQYQAIPAGQKGPANSGLTARQAFLQKLNPADRDALIKNTGTLESMGVLK